MYFGRKAGHARVDESKLGRWLPGLLYLTIDRLAQMVG